MPPSAAIIVPTRQRAGYLEVTLATVAPQARAAGAEVIVVDDGPDDATRACAERHGARYVRHEAHRGLNVARNSGFAASDAELLVLIDDDVAAPDGWLDALLAAHDAEPPDVGALTGPIRARLEDHRFRMCGREGPPITWQDLGDADADSPHAWGANLAVRRGALERAGAFDDALSGPGDELEWERRLLAAGLRIRYIAAAGLDHRRACADAQLRSLCRAAYRRGLASRRFDAAYGTTPSLAHELRVLAGCLVHGPRFRCMNGPVLSAQSLGRLVAALGPGGRSGTAAGAPVPTPAADDFLSGASGTVGGFDGALRGLRDRLLDARAALGPRRRRLARAAEALPRRRVLVLGVERPGLLMDAARAELLHSRHDVRVQTAGLGELGKFENLNALLDEHPATNADWLLVVDDDVRLPPHFLDRFLAAAEGAGLRIAQPAHRLRSHAAWEVTRRVGGATARTTTFVEIGPVTAFHRDTFATLLPFPPLRMGWGLDLHWAALAREHGWPIGVVDATPVEHLLAPVGAGYSRDIAIAEAREFLRDRPYLRRDEVRTLGTRR